MWKDVEKLSPFAPYRARETGNAKNIWHKAKINIIFYKYV